MDMCSAKDENLQFLRDDIIRWSSLSNRSRARMDAGKWVTSRGYRLALALPALMAGCTLVVPRAAEHAPPGDGTAEAIAIVHVPGGCFQMGDVFGVGEPEEQPVHEVCLGAFDIGKYEVTQGQWRKVMGTNPSRDPHCREEDCPVESVSWDEVQEFIRRLNAGSGSMRWRLPTEAEWEYAARSGGKRERYSGGDDLDRLAWYSENSGRRNHRVGTKAPNGLGVHDMSGNVWEWTSDWYADDYYSGSPREDPRGPRIALGPEVDRVIRGGCKTGEADNARTSRRSYGFRRSSSDRSDKIGFRLARSR
jgi:formylglycine-generating enzyme required for sulfatase activity